MSFLQLNLFLIRSRAAPQYLGGDLWLNLDQEIVAKPRLTPLAKRLGRRIETRSHGYRIAYVRECNVDSYQGTWQRLDYSGLSKFWLVSDVRREVDFEK